MSLMKQILHFEKKNNTHVKRDAFSLTISLLCGKVLN